MDEWQNKLIEQAGPLGAALGVIIVAVGTAVARAKGWLGLGAPPKKGSEPESKGDANDEVMTELREINQRLGSFDRRINDLEHDLKSRPTSEDIHKVQTAIAVMANSIDHFGEKMGATGAAVTRIEDFLLMLSKRKS